MTSPSGTNAATTTSSAKTTRRPGNVDTSASSLHQLQMADTKFAMPTFLAPSSLGSETFDTTGALSAGGGGGSSTLWDQDFLSHLSLDDYNNFYEFQDPSSKEMASATNIAEAGMLPAGGAFPMSSNDDLSLFDTSPALLNTIGMSSMSPDQGNYIPLRWQQHKEQQHINLPHTARPIYLVDDDDTKSFLTKPTAAYVLNNNNNHHHHEMLTPSENKHYETRLIHPMPESMMSNNNLVNQVMGDLRRKAARKAARQQRGKQLCDHPEHHHHRSGMGYFEKPTTMSSYSYNKQPALSNMKYFGLPHTAKSPTATTKLAKPTTTPTPTASYRPVGTNNHNHQHLKINHNYNRIAKPIKFSTLLSVTKEGSSISRPQPFASVGAASTASHQRFLNKNWPYNSRYEPDMTEFGSRRPAIDGTKQGATVAGDSDAGSNNTLGDSNTTVINSTTSDRPNRYGSTMPAEANERGTRNRREQQIRDFVAKTFPASGSINKARFAEEGLGDTKAEDDEGRGEHAQRRRGDKGATEDGTLSVDAKGREGSKAFKDKGYARHGWKNVYHKEEWGEAIKYHDVWR